MEGNKIAFLMLLCFVGGIRKCLSETTRCNPIACKTAPCSTNVDCECLSSTSNPASGICAALVLSCTSLVRCNSEGHTCPIENTICVNNTRCQYPVCYPLALASRLVCPSLVTTTTTRASIIPDFIDTSCPIDQTSFFSADANQEIDFRTRFPSCPMCVAVVKNGNAAIHNVCSTRQLNITANGNGAVTVQQPSICPGLVNISVEGNARVYNVCSSQQFNVIANSNGVVTMQQSSVCPSYVNLTLNANGAVYNVCATQDLNITANSNGIVTMQQSSICPKFVNISAGGNARVYNVCVTEQLNILNATGNNIISFQTQQSSICPKIVNLSAGGNARVFNICVSDQLTVLSAIGNNIVSMDYKQMSACPKVVNILDGGGNAVFYVCATQAINAKLSGIAKLYYKGPLNHTQISSLASIQQWI